MAKLLALNSRRKPCQALRKVKMKMTQRANTEVRHLIVACKKANDYIRILEAKAREQIIMCRMPCILALRTVFK